LIKYQALIKDCNCKTLTKIDFYVANQLVLKLLQAHSLQLASSPGPSFAWDKMNPWGCGAKTAIKTLLDHLARPLQNCVKFGLFQGMK